MMLKDFTQLISYEVSADGFRAGVDSSSASFGTAMLAIILSLVALFFFVVILMFLFKSTRKNSSEETESIASRKGEDPEKDIVENVFKR